MCPTRDLVPGCPIGHTKRRCRLESSEMSVQDLIVSPATSTFLPLPRTSGNPEMSGSEGSTSSGRWRLRIAPRIHSCMVLPSVRTWRRRSSNSTSGIRVWIGFIQSAIYCWLCQTCRASVGPRRRTLESNTLERNRSHDSMVRAGRGAYVLAMIERVGAISLDEAPRGRHNSPPPRNGLTP